LLLRRTTSIPTATATMITTTIMPPMSHQLRPTSGVGTGVGVVGTGVVGAGVVGLGVVGTGVVGAGVVGAGVVGAGVVSLGVVGAGVGTGVVGAGVVGAGLDGLRTVKAVKWLALPLIVWVVVFTVMPSRTTQAPLTAS